jgi:peptidyl-prolyl cis-trans isomerase D
MLKFIRRLEKTRNFIILTFAVVMVASLVFFYAPTGRDITANLAMSSETAARVGSEYITVGDIARQRESTSRFNQGRMPPAASVLDNLISSRIVRLEAARLGLTASDREVADQIRREFRPEDGKPFDQKQYEQIAVDQAGSVSAFESSFRDYVSEKKLRAFVTSAVTVSEEEVLRDFQRRNTKFDLTYVSLNPTELAQSIVPTDAELREYFERNKQAYYISVPQKKIRYVFLQTAKIGETLPITDEELRTAYDALPDDKRISGVLGQEIVLRVSKPEFEGQVFQKATELIQTLRAGGPTVSEEAFAQIARGHSENAATAANGGKLRGPVRENPNRPDDPYQRLLAMKPGEITEPIDYEGRYFILRRGEAVPKSFDEAKRELEVSLRNRRGYAAAAELAEQAVQTLRENKDVKATAEAFAARANMNVSEMIRETGFVKPGDTVENIGVSPQFEEGIAPLENVNDVGDKIPVPEGFAIPMLVDRREPRDSEFDEVREQIVEVVKLEKARERVEEYAKEIASGAASPAALNALAQARGAKTGDTKSFILGSPLGDGPMASTSMALEDAIYAMKPGEVTKTPIKAGDNWYVVGITGREDASMEDFANQRDLLTEQMLVRKRGEVFIEYLAAVRQRMEAANQIRIFDSAMGRFEDDSPFPFGLG